MPSRVSLYVLFEVPLPSLDATSKAGAISVMSRDSRKIEEVPFWKQKSLEELSRSEWESLCDGCGKCCLHKIEDFDTGEIVATRVACKLLDITSCQCSDYKNRKKHVSDCQILTPKKVRRLTWLPSTCAYRLIDEGKELPSWHPLRTGHAHSVHKAGMSVRGKVIRERENMDLEDFVVDCLL